MAQQDNEFIDDKEVSRITGIATTTLARWRCQKLNLPYHKIGGAIRYKKSDLNDYIEKHRISVGAA